MCNLTALIGIIMIHNPVRNYAYLDLMRILGVSKHTVKQLVFAWLHQSSEENLQKILKGGQPND